MKDAKGHGSNAHSEGVNSSVPSVDAAKNGLMSDSQIAQLKAAYAGINTIDPSMPSYGKLTKLLDSSAPERIRQLAGAGIKFVSKLAANRLPRDAALPRYSAEAVNSAIASSNRAGRRIGGREAKMIHSLLKGRG